MRKYLLLFLLSTLVFTGAGCTFGNKSSGTATDGGVFRTSNKGEVWAQVNTLPTIEGVASISNVNITALEMDPQDSNTIYASTTEDGLLFTNDGGRSWQRPLQTALRSGRIHAVAVSAKDVCTVFVAKGRRLYKTENCMRSFDDEAYVETREGVNIYRVAVDWFNPQVVWLGLSNGDIMKSQDGGKNWRNMLSTQSDITGIVFHQTDSRVVLVSTNKIGFFKTTDGGKTWTNVQKALSDYLGAKVIYFMEQDARSRLVIAATRYGIMRSDDFGDSWKPITVLTAPGEVLISAAAVDPKDPTKMYYGTKSTFYSTQDSGVTWNTVKIPTGRSQSAMVIDPKDTGVIYVGMFKVEGK